MKDPKQDDFIKNIVKAVLLIIVPILLYVFFFAENGKLLNFF